MEKTLNKIWKKFQKGANYLSYIGFVTCVILLFFCRECGNNCPDGITIYDTIPYYDTQTYHAEIIPEKPDSIVYKPVYISVTEKDTVWEIDTTEIIKNHFSEFHYQKSYSDENLLATIDWYNFENKTPKMLFNYKLKRPVLQVTPKQVIDHRKTKVYIGFEAGSNWNKLSPAVSVEGLLQTKKDHIYGARIDPFNQFIGGKMYWKIKLKK